MQVQPSIWPESCLASSPLDPCTAPCLKLCAQHCRAAQLAVGPMQTAGRAAASATWAMQVCWGAGYAPYWCLTEQVHCGEHWQRGQCLTNLSIQACYAVDTCAFCSALPCCACRLPVPTPLQCQDCHQVRLAGHVAPGPPTYRTPGPPTSRPSTWRSALPPVDFVRDMVWFEAAPPL